VTCLGDTRSHHSALVMALSRGAYALHVGLRAPQPQLIIRAASDGRMNWHFGDQRKAMQHIMSLARWSRSPRCILGATMPRKTYDMLIRGPSATAEPLNRFAPHFLTRQELFDKLATLQRRKCLQRPREPKGQRASPNQALSAQGLRAQLQSSRLCKAGSAAPCPHGSQSL